MSDKVKKIIGFSILGIIIIAIITIVCIYWPAIKGFFKNEKYYSKNEVDKAVTDAYNKGVGERADLEEQLEILKSRYDEITITFNKTNTELEKNKEELKKAQEDNQSLNLKIKEQENTITDLNKKIDDLNKRIKYYEELLVNKDFEGNKLTFYIDNEIFLICFVNENININDILTIPTKDGFDFLGWSKTQGGEEAVNFQDYEVTQDENFYAIFKDNRVWLSVYDRLITPTPISLTRFEINVDSLRKGDLIRVNFDYLKISNISLYNSYFLNNDGTYNSGTWSSSKGSFIATSTEPATFKNENGAIYYNVIAEEGKLVIVFDTTLKNIQPEECRISKIELLGKKENFHEVKYHIQDDIFLTQYYRSGAKLALPPWPYQNGQSVQEWKDLSNKSWTYEDTINSNIDLYGNYVTYKEITGFTFTFTTDLNGLPESASFYNYTSTEEELTIPASVTILRNGKVIEGIDYPVRVGTCYGENLSHLRKVTIKNGATVLGSLFLKRLTSLETLILEGTDVTKISDLDGISQNLKIYVPDSAYQTYVLKFQNSSSLFHRMSEL